MTSPDEGPAGAEIIEALQTAPAEAWKALKAASEALAGLTEFATWAGGEVVATSTIDGEERPVRQMPYPVYSETVLNLFDRLAALGLMVPFDWMHWDDLARYRDHPSELETAPVGDAVRILVAVRRSERFVEGSIEGALESGLVQTALARLIRWHAEQSPTGD